MKYRLLTIAACLIVTASLLLIPIDAKPAAIDPAPHCYPRVAVVVSMDGEQVTARDCVGYDWQFLGDDWQIGDCAALLLHDNGTPDDIRDDLVIDARYSSFTIAD